MKNRQLEILIFLLKHQKTTYTEMAHFFEVSNKTIERDINRLSTTGIPVYCQQGSGGGVYIDENYKFSTSFFTPDEISHMVTALHIAQNFTINKKNEMVLHKLSLVAPNITKMFEENVCEYFNLDLHIEPVDFEADIFNLINQCLDFQLLANIDDFTDVVCLGYVYKTDGIYLFVYIQEYKLLRIRDIYNFTCTSVTYDKNFLTYSEYKNLFKPDI